MSEKQKDALFKKPAGGIRRTVSNNNQIQLPEYVIKEIGVKSGRFEVITGPKVAWYYHESDEKAVLSNDKVDRSSLQQVGITKLSGMDNDDLDTENPGGARITIVDDLPADLYRRLTSSREVILKPIYAGNHSVLNSTCISVYPAEEYDRGLLDNVEQKLREQQATGETPEESDPPVGRIDSHTNCI